ncbi:hypothetical protein EX895_004722 [Sporisorium graminicola]|uniref:Protein kinase domain-containing protein n=1 Tax=Sporisorium graminicola TaxID=280036 RepID=A0A4U7KQK3_9BASI|nr:hypothetical protein EX895_004722 [Sporisorium graminicola]TKY86573.1 hypothetical protein EX895_004722 [Sporisorium graminicola]
MAPASCSSSRTSSTNQPGPSTAPMVAIKNVKPPTTKTRAPWQLDTFWSSSHKRTSPSRQRSPVLGDSYESSNGFDLADLPLTPPDSGASAFELHAAANADPSHIPTRDHVLVSSRAASPSVLASDTHSKPAQKKPSKNDIFNSPISWLTPPSRPVAIPPGGPETSPPPPPSRNSLFFSSFGNSSPAPPSPPPPLPPPRTTSTQLNRDAAKSKQTGTAPSDSTAISVSGSTQSESQTQPQQSTGRKKGHTRNSSLGRASTEECLQEEARIRATKHVDFRLCPTNDFLLGEGRHCSVYLGSYRPRLDAVPSDSSTAWRLCAVKRLHADRQSQLLGLEEAFALRRLGTHPNVIQLIDIRDEVEFAASSQHTPQPSTPDPPQRRKEQSSAQLGIGLGLPRSASRSPNGGHASHSRSTSDMTGKDELRNEAQSHKRALAHEKQHEAALARGILHEADSIVSSREPHRSRVSTLGHPQSAILPTPTFLVQGPDGDALDARPTYNHSLADSDIATARRSSSNASTINPPRLLILLELLPNNLALFARKHRERIDLQQWFDWALQISEALLFLHEKGCVHADIKKENMLLTEDLNVKLCDFNSAVFPNPSDPPRDGLGLGTPAYCAPELSRATGGPSATSFSYPIDIFSLGAVLYSLATGYEPFSKARSVVEMLHRKRLFFESEENDRASRLAVEAGSNPNSQPASRSGSLRGRPSKASSTSTATNANDAAASPVQLASSLNRLLQHSSPTSHTARRDASSDSLESVASSITTISGRNPTSLAVSRLLEPTDEPRGLLVDPSTLSRSSSLLREMGRSADVRRCASTGGRKALSTSVTGLQRMRAAGEVVVDPTAEHAEVGSTTTNVSTGTSAKSPAGAAIAPLSALSKVTLLELASRPDWLRRRSSYGDEIKSHPPAAAAANAYLSPAATISEHTPADPDAALSSTPAKPSRLRSMFSPTSSQFGRPASSSSPPTPGTPDAGTPALRGGSSDGDTRAYADGHPAIVLPGGGRLPDWARDLLRDMLQADPARRPTALQVRERLQAHAHLL